MSTSLNTFFHACRISSNNWCKPRTIFPDEGTLRCYKNNKINIYKNTENEEKQHEIKLTFTQFIYSGWNLGNWLETLVFYAITHAICLTNFFSAAKIKSFQPKSTILPPKIDFFFSSKNVFFTSEFNFLLVFFFFHQWKKNHQADDMGFWKVSKLGWNSTQDWNLTWN